MITEAMRRAGWRQGKLSPKVFDDWQSRGGVWIAKPSGYAPEVVTQHPNTLSPMDQTVYGADDTAWMPFNGDTWTPDLRGWGEPLTPTAPGWYRRTDRTDPIHVWSHAGLLVWTGALGDQNAMRPILADGKWGGPILMPEVSNG